MCLGGGVCWTLISIPQYSGKDAAHLCSWVSLVLLLNLFRPVSKAFHQRILQAVRLEGWLCTSLREMLFLTAIMYACRTWRTTQVGSSGGITIKRSDCFLYGRCKKIKYVSNRLYFRASAKWKLLSLLCLSVVCLVYLTIRISAVFLLLCFNRNVFNSQKKFKDHRNLSKCEKKRI